jgi:hypothetical protein
MPNLSQSGKPLVYLLEDPSKEKAHVQNYTNKPETIAQYGDLVDALFRIVIGKELMTEDLDVLKKAMKSPHKLVWEEAGRRMMQLSHYFPTVIDALFELLGDRKAKIRVRVIQSIWADRPPEDIMKRILDQGLKDVSSEVRLFSEDRAGTHLK